ncbi:MAG: CBS domain-containing protein [Patescibacteria group bacterium]|jgi:predicted transcriptional regulator
MPYLSQIVNTNVRDSADTTVGKLVDILIMPRPGSYPPLEYLKIKDRRNKRMIFIPYRFVQLLGKHDVVLSGMLEKIPVQETVPNELVGLQHTVLDQQIVDVAGIRVVRVNDVRFGTFEDRMCVVGIDVSFLGLLRRLGLEWLDFFGLLKVNLIDWRQAKLVHGLLKLKTERLDINELHPADLANIVEDLNVKHGSRLMISMSTDNAAKVFEEVDPHLQAILMKYLDPEQSASILAKMSVDEVVDLIKMMPADEAKALMSYLQSAQQSTVQKLMAYKSDTAGGLMTVEYVTVRPDWTVEQVIEEVKKSSPAMTNVLYFYITGDDGHYYGKASLRWLIKSPSDQKVKDLLEHYPPSPSLRADMEIDEIARIMTKYNLLTAPVLDGDRHLIGVVTIDDVIRRLVPDA